MKARETERYFALSPSSPDCAFDSDSGSVHDHDHDHDPAGTVPLLLRDL